MDLKKNPEFSTTQFQHIHKDFAFLVDITPKAMTRSLCIIFMWLWPDHR